MVIKLTRRSYYEEPIQSYFFFISFMFLLFSCGEQGGTIIIKNDYSIDKTVTVYSDFSASKPTLGYYSITYKDKYGPQEISPYGTVNISVNTDATYGIVWKHEKIDEYKTVGVSKGETIEVTIP